MSNYKPDRWVVIKITPPDRSPVYKVFGSWYGDYDHGDRWRTNSGIVKAVDDVLGKEVYFHGTSGSVYTCNYDAYGMTCYGSDVLKEMIAASFEHNGTVVEIVSEDSNFTGLNYV